MPSNPPHPTSRSTHYLSANAFRLYDAFGTIIKGISLWNQYCEQENPSLKKAEAYAAALQYFVEHTLLHQATITQSQVAKEYEVPTATVSRNYLKLKNALALNENDLLSN